MDYEPDTPVLISVGKGENYSSYVAVYTSRETETLLVVNQDYKDGPIFAVIQFDKEKMSPRNFYISKEDTGSYVENYTEQREFWKYDKDHFAIVPFGEKKLIEVMKKSSIEETEDYVDNLEKI